MAGVSASDLCAASGFARVADPYTGQEWVAIPAIQPDWAILHVQVADLDGNIRITGPKYDDVLLAKAARNVLVTCEERVPGAAFSVQPELTDLPGFLVSALAHVPAGAAPGSCFGRYESDPAFFSRYLSACGTAETYREFLLQVCAPAPARGGAGHA